MHRAGRVWFCLWLCLLGLAACSDSTDGPFRNYTETGDLADIREHGVLRLLAPRFDAEEEFVWEGVPTSEFRREAEALAESLGLQPRWVYADDFAELSVMLNAGQADLIVTHYSRTDWRRERLSFCTPLAVVREVLVLPADRVGMSVADLGPLIIAAPRGTAYLETARNLARRHDNVEVDRVSGELSEDELLRGIMHGQYDAVIMDEPLFKALSIDYPELRAGPVVQPRRAIAWAVRKSSPDLREAVNRYIVAHRIKASQQDHESRDWPAILNSGVLRVITSNNPASYFMWRGELMGFDYDLIRDFAQRYDLRLSMIVRDSPARMLAALENGEGDVIAASMSVTPARRGKGWHYSEPYLEVREQIVGPASASPFEDLSELAGRKVTVAAGSAFVETLRALQNDGIGVEIEVRQNVSSEILMDRVAKGELDLTMADSHLVAMEQGYRDDLKVLWTLRQPRQIAWGVRENQPQLRHQLNDYIKRVRDGQLYRATFDRYFLAEPARASHSAERVEPGKPISPYDDLVREHALKHGFDWLMITAQMYQESHFDPLTRSFSGAEGLMQVMPLTARQLGYQNLTDPAEGIGAGVAYLDWLEGRFPARLDLAEKTYFGLAAYNAGFGHVEDARRLAQRLGKDPDRWFGNVEEAMALLSHPRYARQARYGYVRGQETVQYVRDIRTRYLGYLSATEKQ
ncbi:transporter substrate-binding domain-containing protein [Alloalcanivorax xenomutans]|uniref:Transporter substrate-binding domain-containing protein n=1 Tax=Alloalcanivorax xenomutans TaxID=1094342 RepID=A0A9Q3W517_9GAMM|nr:transporter substrate-binding domain-containing protein [Alloalcanivorax xenomutans]MCE7508699.1 transporter substrate-binding domain-containing protein [Alloalcanivorax xenomutans]